MNVDLLHSTEINTYALPMVHVYVYHSFLPFRNLNPLASQCNNSSQKLTPGGSSLLLVIWEWLDADRHQAIALVKCKSHQRTYFQGNTFENLQSSHHFVKASVCEKFFFIFMIWFNLNSFTYFISWSVPCKMYGCTVAIFFRKSPKCVWPGGGGVSTYAITWAMLVYCSSKPYN